MNPLKAPSIESRPKPLGKDRKKPEGRNPKKAISEGLAAFRSDSWNFNNAALGVSALVSSFD